MFVFVSALVTLFYTDWDHKLLPNRITYPLALFGLATSPFNPALDLAPGMLGNGTGLGRVLSALAGAALGYGIFWVLGFTWQVLFHREAMGGGDLKLMLGVGAILGIPGVVTTIFLGSMVGALMALPFLLLGRWGMTRELPFGCFLAPAALFSAFYGQELVVWYLGLLPPI
jgi:leader peptidase (prepilin peptidase)/N-methyltransferase